MVVLSSWSCIAVALRSPASSSQIGGTVVQPDVYAVTQLLLSNFPSLLRAYFQIGTGDGVLAYSASRQALSSDQPWR